MKTTIFFILLSLFLSGEARSQGVDSTSRIETEHFIIDRYFVGKHTTDYLTLKGGNPLAKWEKGMNNMYSVRFENNLKQQDFIDTLREELIKPYLGAFLDTLPPDSLKEMKMVILKYQFDIHQKLIGCSLQMPGGLFDRYPQLEPLLYQWAEGAKAFDFTRYKVTFWDKEKFGYGELIILAGYYVNWLNRERRKQSVGGPLSR
ncbi:hypothetical protein [Parabacteroides sp. ZJ-118]|uniref:hypothetical protein n=1 Tax=Parabacteroides sp. ZJ-118 TaxID=2709398 RepID=UPI0013ECA906|nr:hypothetical protein [Parabacteroides sp. ZJ-118]